MTSRRRVLRYLVWVGGGALVGGALALLLLNLVARTDRGREFVLAQTLGALAPNVQGRLEVDSISGNLFQGARLYGVSLVDAEGQPFVVADSAYLDYALTTLVTPRIVFEQAVLWNPAVYVTRMPGDSLWNYQLIFQDTTPNGDTPGPERVTFLNDVQVRNGTVTIVQPWVPDSTLSPRAREAEEALALSDTGTLVVRRVTGGLVQQWTFREMNGRFSEIAFAPGSEAGSRFHVDSLSAEAQVFRTPFRIREMNGVIALLTDRVELNAPVMRLDSSLLAMHGIIRFPSDTSRVQENAFDLTFTSDDVAFRDLRWLYPRFPEEARGSLRFLIETRPEEGLMFLARDARVRAPGTLLTGSFGMILGDTLRFVDVDLEAQPLNVDVIEEMLPTGLPVRGLRIGGAEIRGSAG